MSGVKAPAKDDFTWLFDERTLTINGRELRFRELSVKENDACIDAARQKDGTIDGRLNMLMIISKSAVEPTISLDQLASFPNRVYLQIAEFVNDLNLIDDAVEEP